MLSDVEFSREGIRLADGALYEDGGEFGGLSFDRLTARGEAGNPEGRRGRCDRLVD